jgi:PAS domain S-box-containing protein
MMSDVRRAGADRVFQQFLDSAPDAMLGVAPSGHIVVANRQAELMFGLSRIELLGRTVEDLMPARFRVAHRQHRCEYARDPRTRPMGARLSLFGLRKDGIEFPAEISLSTIDVGMRHLTMAAVRDITDRLHTQTHVPDDLRRREMVGAMLTAERAERSRIAGALHDDTVQVMTAALVSLERVAQAVSRCGDAEVQALVADTQAVVAQATERARRLAFELRPAVLQERGIAHALSAMVEQAGREIGAEVSVSAPEERFDWTLEELVYRTVQEAVANIRKHSHANHITVCVDRLTDRLAAVVADDGAGFDVAAATDPSTEILHMGLHSMIERVRGAGGWIHIESRRAGGTRVAFHLPIGR